MEHTRQQLPVTFSKINQSAPISEMRERKKIKFCHYDTHCHTKKRYLCHRLCQNCIGKLFVIIKVENI